MKVVFVAHKLRGDLQANLLKVSRILLTIRRLYPDVLPIAPYIQTCALLNDSVESEREAGMELNFQLIRSGIVKELWVCSECSSGVLQEIIVATRNDVPVKLMYPDICE